MTSNNQVVIIFPFSNRENQPKSTEQKRHPVTADNPKGRRTLADFLSADKKSSLIG